MVGVHGRPTILCRRSECRGAPGGAGLRVPHFPRRPPGTCGSREDPHVVTENAAQEILGTLFHIHSNGITPRHRAQLSRDLVRPKVPELSWCSHFATCLDGLHDALARHRNTPIIPASSVYYAEGPGRLSGWCSRRPAAARQGRGERGLLGSGWQKWRAFTGRTRAGLKPLAGTRPTRTSFGWHGP